MDFSSSLRNPYERDPVNELFSVLYEAFSSSSLPVKAISVSLAAFLGYRLLRPALSNPYDSPSLFYHSVEWDYQRLRYFRLFLLLIIEAFIIGLLILAFPTEIRNDSKRIMRSCDILYILFKSLLFFPLL